MMDQFQIRYIPGGMTLNRSAWYLCLIEYYNDGEYLKPLKKIREA